MTGPRSAGDKSQPGGPVHRGLHCLRPTHRRPQGLGPLHYRPCHWHPCGIMPKLPPARHMLCQLSMGIYSSHPERPRATVDDYIHRSTPAITITSHHDNQRHCGDSGTGTRAGTYLTGRPGGATEHPHRPLDLPGTTPEDPYMELQRSL